MVSQHGIKFAVHLITSHFGNIVAKVCEKLLCSGPLTLEQLIRYTELSREHVKNSLLVLIQHNCVQAFIPEGGEDVNPLRVRTQYLVLFDNILHRLRFPKFLEIVSRELGEQCEGLLDGLLKNGRLTLKQMVDNASDLKENAVSPDVLRESLCKLLTARYVERCPATELAICTLVEEENTTRKRGAKSAKILVVPETIEQRVIEAAKTGEAIRFSFTTDMGCNSDREIKSEDSQLIRVGENVAREELILWRANFEEFIRYHRHKVLIETVRTRMDDGAAIVLSAILEASRTVERKVKIENSVPLSLDTIFTEVMKTENGRTMTIDRVRACLVQLGCSPRDEYIIDLKGIIQWARNEEVESIVLNRYGRDAYRMFRHLSKENKFCPTDKIADATLVEKKEAPKLLYRLWQDNYLHMEKLVVVATRQIQLLMWKVNEPLLWENVLDEMYHAALNLTIRLAFEKEKEEELLVLNAKEKVWQSAPLEKKFKRLRNVCLLLGSSLMKLDDGLMLFHDF